MAFLRDNLGCGVAPGSCSLTAVQTQMWDMCLAPVAMSSMQSFTTIKLTSPGSRLVTLNRGARGATKPTAATDFSHEVDRLLLLTSNASVIVLQLFGLSASPVRRRILQECDVEHALRHVGS